MIRDDLEQIAHRHHAVDLEHLAGLVQPQFGRQHAPVSRIHVLLHFQPDDRCKPALAQFRFDQVQQIVGLILVAFGDGVAGDAEQLAGLHHHARKQQIEVVGDHILQRHVQILVADLEEARNPGTDRHLDSRQPAGVIVGVAHRHQQVERQVGNKRERMRRIHGLRRDQRENIAQIILPHLLALGSVRRL